MKITSIAISSEKSHVADSEYPEPRAPLISADHYIRMTFNELSKTNFAHLFSSPDEDVDKTLETAGMPYALGGFTEWNSLGSPAISIGWDWYIDKPTRKVLIAPEQVRSNLMLRTRHGYDVGQNMTSDILKLWTESIAWKSVIRSITNTLS